MVSYRKPTVRYPILLLLASAPAFAANDTNIESIAGAQSEIYTLFFKLLSKEI